jgi:TRAP-type C4-dicarboxylate transport system permease small subunit
MARYCFIWLIYVGMVLSLNRGAHASTDILGLFLTGRAKKTVQLAVHCMAVALFAVLFFQGVGLVRMVGGQVSPAMRISIMIPYAALPFGSALMIIEELRIMAGIARRNDREERQ